MISLRRIVYIGLILFGILLMASGTALGAALWVDGDASPVKAAPGNSNNILMVISVMDQNGNAVSGLRTTNFAVGSIVVGPGSALSDLKSASEASGACGFLTLTSRAAWNSGAAREVLLGPASPILPSFYMRLKDSHAHWEMIQALESRFRVEECSFNSIFDTFEGHRIYASRKVAEKRI